ncbi:MAG: FAD-dependent monooxygenase [Hyphomicrobiales bacterium]|nr:FAD-dependent monooxygenase [Hyphomicrobiales bacterium]
MSNSAPDSMDAIVVGAGPVGLAATLALLRAGVKTALIGARPPRRAANPDSRTAALIGSSVELLEALGVWSACAKDAAALESLVLIDQTRRMLRAPDVIFRADEIDAPAFGYNIGNAALTEALLAAVEARGDAALLRWGAVESVRPDTHGVMVTMAGGDAMRARLVIGADGRDSLCRDASGVRSRRWSYNHTAVACAFEHAAPHNGVCVELHRAAGPLTAVPAPNGRSSLVWVERPAEAERLMTLSERGFADELETHLGQFTGRIGAIGRRAAFPLGGLAVLRYAQNRIMLVGEAAHVVPPIGAQGLNLGFRDAAALAEIVAAAHRRAEDVGAAAVLSAYDAARRGDVLSRTLAADLLNRTLIAGFVPFDAARLGALSALSAAPALKRSLMRRGVGPDRAA